MSDLTALRAEVERLRDEMTALAMKAAPDILSGTAAASVGVHCYTRVLDLIDKHTREGQ